MVLKPLTVSPAAGRSSAPSAEVEKGCGEIRRRAPRPAPHRAQGPGRAGSGPSARNLLVLPLQPRRDVQVDRRGSEQDLAQRRRPPFHSLGRDHGLRRNRQPDFCGLRHAGRDTAEFQMTRWPWFWRAGMLSMSRPACPPKQHSESRAASVSNLCSCDPGNSPETAGASVRTQIQSTWLCGGRSEWDLCVARISRSALECCQVSRPRVDDPAQRGTARCHRASQPF